MPDDEIGTQGMPSDGDSLPVYRALGNEGFIGIAWPKDLGGHSLTHVEASLVEEVLGYHWLPLSQYLLTCKTVGAALLKFGDRQLRDRLIPQMARGQLAFCQGFSEPRAGSDLSALATRASIEGDQFVVRGRKIWTSGAREADWIYLAVRTDPQAQKHRGISVLVADITTPGIEIRPFRTMGGGTLSEIVLDGVVVPRTNLVGAMNQGWSVLMHTLDFERVTSEKVGALAWMLDALDACRLDASGRERVVALRGEHRACRLLSLKAAWLLSRGEDASAAASMTKLSAGLLAQKVASTAIDVLGVDGLKELEGPLRGRAAALYRASVAATISGGAAEVQRIVIARRGLGCPAA